MRKRKEFRHLTEHDRDRLHALYGHGHTQKDIAEVLGVSPGTISRELNRYPRTTWRYNANRVQQDAAEKRSRSKRPGMKIADDPELRRYIIRELKRLRSPDEIAGRMRAEGIVPRVGTMAIYKWLYSEDGRKYCRYLCTKRTKKKRQGGQAKRVLIPARIPLNDRPNEVHLVHAEGDLFVSPVKSGSRRCGLLVVDRESLLLAGSIIANKGKKEIVPAMQAATAALAADTCTLDNGIENVHHQEFGVSAYFCDPGTPTQKPYAESSIGLIRRWFNPKGTNLDGVSNDTYRSQLHLLNHKYRKSLGYLSAYEYALARGTITRVPRISLARAIAFR